ncbi:MAG: SpoIID/LytB domain-containing protein, partial [Bacteroidota bacterium]
VITAFSSMLKMVNSVFIDHYVSGVVEAEAGKEEPLEYYKVQSIICRTYALNNLRRHAEEGFYLCDKVHCQVFKGKSQSNPDIVKATQKTTGIVLVDSEINLITAAFHSNCGGHTVNSEDVWVSAVPYLRAREDTFCLNERNAIWHKTIPRAAWLSYLDNRFQYPSSIKLFARSATEHCQNERKLILSPLKTNTYLKVIRSDWKLRSTFFCIDPEKDSITLHGKGYGHGVGLCQEGAMRQAKLGRDYQSILHYYYKDVHLVDLSVMEFFRAE